MITVKFEFEMLFEFIEAKAVAARRVEQARQEEKAERAFLERQLLLDLPLDESSRARSASEDAQTFVQGETPAGAPPQLDLSNHVPTTSDR